MLKLGRQLLHPARCGSCSTRLFSSSHFKSDLSAVQEQLSKLEKRWQLSNLNKNASRGVREVQTRLSQLHAQLRESSELFDLALELGDERVLRDCEAGVVTMREEARELMIESIMTSNDKFRNDCFLEIHPGVGGADAFDWVRMLVGMYLLWAKSCGRRLTLLEAEDSGDGGYRSALLKCTGENSFGWLSAEAGVHRLVRISPFDPTGKRHTSFAQVVVYPEIDEKSPSNDFRSEIRIETFKSSGPGGQHVNTTDSAVRVIHIPTKTVVTCQNDRSQIRNKETALSVLQSKLELLRKEQSEQEQRLNRLGTEAGTWGNQIRSVVLAPYTKVKDHRSGWETSDTNAFLAGELLQEAMEAALLHAHYSEPGDE